jgi:phage I-like protein
MEMLKPKIENAGIKANAVNQKQESDEINAAMQKVKYLQDKTDFIKKPKLAKVLTKEIISEVDNFTQNGSILSFVDGLNYVLGSKFTNGELISKLQSGAEKKAQANAQKKVVAPQTKGSGAVKNEGTLSREERLIARQLGISEKEYAAEKYKEINRKQRKLR